MIEDILHHALEGYVARSEEARRRHLDIVEGVDRLAECLVDIDKTLKRIADAVESERFSRRPDGFDAAPFDPTRIEVPR